MEVEGDCALNSVGWVGVVRGWEDGLKEPVMG